MRWPNCWRPISRCARSICRATAVAMRCRQHAANLGGRSGAAVAGQHHRARLVARRPGGDARGARSSAQDRAPGAAGIDAEIRGNRGLAARHGRLPTWRSSARRCWPIRRPRCCVFSACRRAAWLGRKPCCSNCGRRFWPQPACQQRGTGGRTGDSARHRPARGTAAAGAADLGPAWCARHADAAGRGCLAGGPIAAQHEHVEFLPRRACAASVAS
jgi:hypothetical protein